RSIPLLNDMERGIAMDKVETKSTQLPVTTRPGELLEPINFAELKAELEKVMDTEPSEFDVIAYALYPKVFKDYIENTKKFGDISTLDTPTFFYGMKLGEEIEVEIEKGKTLIIKLISISEPRSDGTRVVFFELNGQPREIEIQDVNVKTDFVAKPKADPTNDKQLGATMPGTVIKVLVEKGEKVKQGDYLLITEAMKMETTVQAPFEGVIKDIHVKNSDAITVGDLLIEFE